MQIPLFPLRTVLFPQSRIPLQIFEPRYVDMIKYCMKENKPFGVVRICHGSEVVNAGVEESLDIEFVGCTAQIVDFDALANNRLRIIAEGIQRFRILETTIAPDQLIVGTVEMLNDEASFPLPEDFADLAVVLQSLLKHPAVSELNISTQYECAVAVANQLAGVLPIDNADKQDLLEIDATEERLALLSEILDELGD